MTFMHNYASVYMKEITINMSGTETVESFGPEMIPESGYVLGATEKLDFAISFDSPEPDGEIAFPHAGEHDSDLMVPYKDVVSFRIGGETDFVDYSVVAIGKPDEGFDGDVRYFMFARGGNYVTSVPTPIAVAGEEQRAGFSTIGRDHEGFRDLPDTVSGDHLRIQQGPDGVLQFENLNPTNTTKLIRSDRNGLEQDQPPRLPESPLTKRATRAVNPLTGKVDAGPVMDDARVGAAARNRILHEERVRIGNAERSAQLDAEPADQRAARLAAEDEQRRRSHAQPRARTLPRS